MTLDEAIKHAEEVADGHDRIKQIKAVTLEECKCASEHRQLAEWLKDYKRLLEQEPCEDCISRQVVLDEISDYNNDLDYTTNELYDKVKRMSSVTPQPKYEDIAKAFQYGMAFGFAKKYDEMDKVMEEIKKVIPQDQSQESEVSE